MSGAGTSHLYASIACTKKKEIKIKNDFRDEQQQQQIIVAYKSYWKQYRMMQLSVFQFEWDNYQEIFK